MAIAEQEIIKAAHVAKHDKKAAQQVLLDEAKLGLLHSISHQIPDK